jgi:hypothetical protein
LGAPAAPLEWQAKQERWYFSGAGPAMTLTAEHINTAAKSFFMRIPLVHLEAN